MRNLIFISDFFADKVSGGAELVDSVIIGELEKRNYFVKKVNSKDISPVFLELNSSSFFFVSNFIQMSVESKDYMAKNCRYLIYEHDHKYLLLRDASVYENYLAPKEHIINFDFYENAQKIFVQTGKHFEVIKKNLQLNNIINLGFSFWSDEEFDILEKNCNNSKKSRTLVLNSVNDIKGTEEAIKICEKKGYDYYLSGKQSFESFIQNLSESERFLFVPKVLESFSRVATEAKMVNTKAMVNKNVSAAYEPWFKKSGEELIRYARNKKKEMIELISSIILGEEQDDSVIAILNLYRRPDNLQEQVDALRNQTVPPKEIWVWRNYHEDSEELDLDSVDVDKWFDSNHNWKFYGRFASALLADSTYVAFFDDDTIPGEQWLEKCIQNIKEKNAILGGIGVRLNSEVYADHVRFGWATKNKDFEEVDLVGHAWFLKREWLSYMWMEKPPTWENGEDIHLSYTCQKYGSIRTLVPPQDNKLYTSSLRGYELGVDEKATSKASNHNIFYKQRDECIKYSLENGWSLVKD